MFVVHVSFNMFLCCFLFQQRRKYVQVVPEKHEPRGRIVRGQPGPGGGLQDDKVTADINTRGNLGGSITVQLTSRLFWTQLFCLCLITNRFILLVKSKQVKQEVSCRVKLSLMLSVLWQH